MSISSQYDNEWTITATNNNAPLQTLQDTPGAFVGNGKIGFITAFESIGVRKSIISVDFDFNEAGSYRNNVIEGFNPTHVRFFDNRSSQYTNESVALSNVQLHMDTGIATSSYTISNTSSLAAVAVSVELYAVRHLPYCTVQTFTVTPAANIASLDIFHEVSCGLNIGSPEYNNSVVFNEAASTSKGLYTISGKGTIEGTNKSAAFCSCYVFEDEVKMKAVGFNVYALDRRRCYQKLAFTSLIQNTNYKFHVITAQMTEYDFSLPQDETRRILVNIINDLNTPTVPLTRLRTAHVNAWVEAWKHNLVIEPKLGITNPESAALLQLKKVIRYNLYNIWSSVRDGAGIEINPSTFSLIDTNGGLFWDGDLFFLPILTIFRPVTAKAFLEARYKNLERARRLAAGYGYDGTKFPYANEVVGYGNSPYWDFNGPLHIFNTALISVGIWNYYRVTMDRSWLLSKGYIMLKDIADFFASKVSVDANGVYNILDVYSINNTEGDNNALTNYLAKLAFKYVLEASYELSMPTSDVWVRCYYNLDMRYFDGLVDVVKIDAAATQLSTYKIVEQLLPLAPYYFEVFLRQNTNRNKDTIERNLQAVDGRIEQAFLTNPLNTILLTWLKGYLMCCDTAYMSTFSSSLESVLATNVVGVWGNFNSNNSTSEYNDLSLSSMFILMLLTGPGTLRIRGMVTETRFYTETMGIYVATSHYMPNTWKNIRINGVGKDKATYNVLNEATYP
jgi:trehalose/maltose hydrolase-like predicted phosphorylase